MRCDAIKCSCNTGYGQCKLADYDISLDEDGRCVEYWEDLEEQQQ